jgi:polyhydroxyalkanoate synthesis regulator protein
MTAFAEQQEQMRATMQKTMGSLFPFGNMEEVGRQNMAMMERAFSLFSPFYRPNENASASDKDAEVALLRAEVERLRKELAEARK